MKILVLLMTTIMTMGCASIRPSNYESPSLSKEELQEIATDGSEILAQKYPPGKTVLALEHDTTFAILLSNALRQHGFAVENEPKEGIILNYIVDPLDSQTVRLGLITNNWRSDVLYLLSHGKATRKNLTQRIN